MQKIPNYKPNGNHKKQSTAKQVRKLLIKTIDTSTEESVRKDQLGYDANIANHQRTAPLHYFRPIQNKTVNYRAKNLQKSNKEQDIGAYFAMVCLTLIILVLAWSNLGLDFFDLSPRYAPLFRVFVYARLLLPTAAFIVLSCGPKSIFRTLTLLVCLPVAVICITIAAFSFWIGTIETTDSGNFAIKNTGEVTQGCHFESVHLEEETFATWSEGWEPTGEIHKLARYQHFGPYFYKKKGEIELPTSLWPSFCKKQDGGLNLVLHKGEATILQADVKDIVEGRFKLGH